MINIIRKILKEEFLLESVDLTTKPNGDIIKQVYNSTPVNQICDYNTYDEYVRKFYDDSYFLGTHISNSDSVLFNDIQLPSERGITYNSADAFFVTLGTSRSEYVHSKTPDWTYNPYYVMIKKGKIINTDYNFSNLPGFFDDFNKTKTESTSIQDYFKYIGDKFRSLGYDIVVPDDGKYEIIIVNPKVATVLGSKKDINQLKQYTQ
jgi:hypothetical protein